MARKKTSGNFEKSLAELETLVERLENGDLTLEESLSVFEQGVRLTRDCQKILTQAEQKISLLLEQNDELTEYPFDPENSSTS